MEEIEGRQKWQTRVGRGGGIKWEDIWSVLPLRFGTPASQKKTLVATKCFAYSYFNHD